MKALGWLILVVIIVASVAVFIKYDGVDGESGDMQAEQKDATEVVMKNQRKASSESTDDTNEVSMNASNEDEDLDKVVGFGPGPESGWYNIVGTNFEFDVKEMRVKKGDEITVVLAVEDGFHDWAIDGFELRHDDGIQNGNTIGTKQIRAGESSTVTFIADKVGEFEYYCSVGNHRELGMVGKLIVEE